MRNYGAVDVRWLLPLVGSAVLGNVFRNENEPMEAIDTLNSCTVLLRALKAVNIDAAKVELGGAKRGAVVLTAMAVTLLVVWMFLTIARFRVLRQRASRFTTDIASGVLAAGAMVSSMIAVSRVVPGRSFPFLNPVKDILRNGTRVANGTQPRSPTYVRYLNELGYSFRRESACLSQFGGQLNVTDDNVTRLEEKGNWVTKVYTSSALYYAAMVFGTLAALLVLVSIAAAILALCATSVNAPTLAPSLATRWRSATPSTTTTSTSVASPRSATFYARFIRAVATPADGVVLDRRDGSDCRICAEVLLEDIAQLKVCDHAFHRKCILAWLVEADEPCCALCRTPVHPFGEGDE